MIYGIYYNFDYLTNKPPSTISQSVSLINPWYCRGPMSTYLLDNAVVEKSMYNNKELNRIAV